MTLPKGNDPHKFTTCTSSWCTQINDSHKFKTHTNLRSTNVLDSRKCMAHISVWPAPVPDHINSRPAQVHDPHKFTTRTSSRAHDPHVFLTHTSLRPLKINGYSRLCLQLFSESTWLPWIYYHPNVRPFKFTNSINTVFHVYDVTYLRPSTFATSYHKMFELVHLQPSTFTTIFI